MWLARLEVRGLRCLREVPELELHPTLNLITGENAAGKTTFLEAIDLLARARSFRSAQPRQLIAQEASEYLLRGRVISHAAGGEEHQLSQRRTADQLELRCDGETLRGVAQLAPKLAVQAIHPESHALVHGAPAGRRAWLDWGVFHVEPQYHQAWSTYQRALKQRNAALKERRQDPTHWDAPLVSAGEELDRMRRAYLEEIHDAVEGFAQVLLPNQELKMEYRPGFDAQNGFREALVSSLEGSKNAGMTLVGPHRADVHLVLDGMPASRTASRGQTKLLSCCLLLAQVALFQELRGENCVLLFDDLTAELDAVHLERLFEALNGCEAQLFATRIGTADERLPDGAEGRLFHVEQGTVSLTQAVD